MATTPTDTTTTTPTQANAAGTVPGLDSLKSALGNSATVDKAKQFAKARPFATAALAGVVGMALLNTLRGR